MIRQLSSRVVYKNRWMTVREDDIERADGSRGIFGVVEKPDFALVIPFDGAGYYVVEQFRYPVGARYLEFPQGSWEDTPGIDPAELARAELAEETGLRARSLTYLGHLYEAYGYSNQGFHVFLAADLEMGDRIATAEEFDLKVAYLSTDEFAAAVLGGQVKDAPTLAAHALMTIRLPSADARPS